MSQVLGLTLRLIQTLFDQITIIVMLIIRCVSLLDSKVPWIRVNENISSAVLVAVIMTLPIIVALMSTVNVKKEIRSD